MDKFQNKYRVQSARLQNWDYGWNAAYFVTICTANRKFFFGDIVDREMKLSAIGELANEFLLKIPEHFPFVKLGAYVVMPNHVHGIIIIDKPDDGRYNEKNDKRNTGQQVQRNIQTPNFVETPKLGVSIPRQSKTAAASRKWKPATLGSIINQYKRTCTIESRKIHAGFAWQPRFHDHIIRDDASYQRIKNYIINNPKNWRDDSFHIL